MSDDIGIVIVAAAVWVWPIAAVVYLIWDQRDSDA